MPITFQCSNPECKKSYTLKDDLAGRRAKCSACGQSMLVPAVSAIAVAPTAAEVPEVPVVQAADPGAALPTMAGRKRSALPFIVAGVGCLVLLLLGGGVIVVAIGALALTSSDKQGSSSDAAAVRSDSKSSPDRSFLPRVLGGKSRPGLDPRWATLAEVASHVYNRGHLKSDLSWLIAVSELPEIERNGTSAQRKCAGELSANIGEFWRAEAARTRADLSDGKQIARLEEFKLKAILDRENFDKNYYKFLRESAERINEFARANQEIIDQKRRGQDIWRAQIMPAIQEAAGPNSPQPLVEVRTEQTSRAVWFAARNVGGKTLNNCSIRIELTQGKHPDGNFPPVDFAWFIREWPADELIILEWHYGKTIINVGSEALGSKNNKVVYQVWCDEGRTPEAPAVTAEPYSIRDAHVLSMMQKGARYVHTSSKRTCVFEFTSIQKVATGYRVEATLSTETPATVGRPEVIRYSGVWSEERTAKNRFIPMRASVNLKPIDAKVIDFHFVWSEGDYKLTGFLGQEWPLSPLPVAK